MASILRSSKSPSDVSLSTKVIFLNSSSAAVFIFILFALSTVPVNVPLVLMVNPVEVTDEKDTFVPAVIKIVSSSPADASNFRLTLLPLAAVVKS